MSPFDNKILSFPFDEAKSWGWLRLESAAHYAATGFDVRVLCAFMSYYCMLRIHISKFLSLHTTTETMALVSANTIVVLSNIDVTFSPH